MSISRSFLHIPGEELASDEVDQLGLCAEHSNDSCCKAQSPHADVRQPRHPPLIAAEHHLRETSDYSTYDINEQQNWWGKQACQRSVGAFFEVIVDIVGAVSYSNAHVKAVGEDKADTAVPVGQEIRDAQKREGQGQHNKIIPVYLFFAHQSKRKTFCYSIDSKK